MNRPVIKFAALGLAIIAAAALTVVGSGHTFQKHAFNPPGTPENPAFSNGLVVGNTLYLSGQEGLVEGKLVPGGIGPETQQALGNIKKVMDLAGYQMSDLVTVNVYLADMGDFTEMTRVYKTLVPEPRPARTTVQVAALVNNARVEISAIAVKQH
jgi:2-iminobutanoate/2-iminopropanoate deaminase